MRVEPGFSKAVAHDASVGRRVNRHYGANIAARVWTLDFSFRDLTVSGIDPSTGEPRTAPDTRIVGVNMGVVGQDGSTDLWATTKFGTGASPTPLATWEEAQLIIAELRGGQEAVTAINRIRDAAPNGPLPHLSESDEVAIRAHVLEERRRVLFGQGYRLADIYAFEELALPTGPRPQKPESVFNTLFDGCLPLPWSEINGNPNLQ